MSEEYSGIKFNVKFVEELDFFPDHAYLIQDLARLFEKKGLCPSYGKGNAGNLSIRTRDGFLITPTGCFYSTMKKEDLVEVLDIDIKKGIVFVRGKNKPSSESLLHYMIYSVRQDANSIIHGHSDWILENAKSLGIPETKIRFPYGSLELAKEATEKALSNDLFILKEHGFVSIAPDIKAAADQVLKLIS